MYAIVITLGLVILIYVFSVWKGEPEKSDNIHPSTEQQSASRETKAQHDRDQLSWDSNMFELDEPDETDGSSITLFEPEVPSLEDQIVFMKLDLKNLLEQARNADGVIWRLQWYNEFSHARRTAMMQLSDMIVEQISEDDFTTGKNLLEQYIKGCATLSMANVVEEAFRFDQVELEQTLASCREQLEKYPSLELLETEREIKRTLDSVLQILAENNVLKSSIQRGYRDLQNSNDLTDDNALEQWVRQQQTKITGERSGDV